ncbi:hypothetical protein FB451DRAFT_1132116 [Mycena latifolia]|nr:hypothetical protein FB451DRAFT_1132116 [Mycena latifolia]
MRSFSRFSLQKFLETVFTSEDPGIKNSAGAFYRDGGAVSLMDIWFKGDGGLRDLRSDTSQWIMQTAGAIGAKELSHLTDRAAQGPHYEVAKTLRITTQGVNVQLVTDFRLRNLTRTYDAVLPNVGRFLKAIIGKENVSTAPGTRNVDDGRTLMTSMALNLRSRRSNLHQVINSFIFWDNKMPKRLVQAMNHLAVSTSYQFRTESVTHLTADSNRISRIIAADPSKLKMMPYDNFNWMTRVWEAAATHGNVKHDQVSALLVILNIPPALQTMPAEELASVARFEEAAGLRHRLPAHQSLAEIVPGREDQQIFRKNSIKHIGFILCKQIKEWSSFRSRLGIFLDPKAIPAHVTELYYLPTFDQEQGSTRGNILVLEHYFIDFLRIPKPVFERIMFFVLGDRLTTSRDRAAQDQRALDRSSFRSDHLSSIAVTSGLMHECLNFIENVGKN